MPTSFSQPNPCLSLSSLKPHPAGELLSQALWGRHQGGLETQSPFLHRKVLVLEISNAELQTA